MTPTHFSSSTPSPSFGILLLWAGLVMGGCSVDAAAWAEVEGGDSAGEGGVAWTPPPPPPDPLGDYLAVQGPSAERESAILDALRTLLPEALDARRTGEERRRVVGQVDALLAELAVLEDWRPLLRAELLAPLGDTAEVDAALATVPLDTGLPGRWGWALRVEAREAARDPAGARRVAEAEARRLAPRGEEAAPLERAGRLALAAGDTAAAVDALLGALAAGPADPAAQGAARALDRLPARAGASWAEVYPRVEGARLEVGEALLAGGAWEAGHRRLLPLLATSPSMEAGAEPLPGGVEARIRVEMARGLVELRRPGEARALLQPMVSADAEGGIAPGASPALRIALEDRELLAHALFQAGRAARQMGRSAEAEGWVLRLAQDVPESPWVEEALLPLAEARLGGGGGRVDDPVVRTFLDVGVASVGSELLAVQFGSRRYLAGGFQEAAQTFDRYLEGARRPAGRQQAAYWAALSHERRGDGEAARARLRTAWEDDPLSFYGLLAGERLDEAVLPAGLAPGPAPQVGAAGTGGEVAAALTRLRVHQIVPTPGSFAFELDRVQEHFFQGGEGVYGLAEGLLAGGFPIQGVVLGREIHRREGGVWNLRLLRIVFPFPYREVIVRESRARGLDPFFVAGLIRQESMFHASIASSAGAIGLMQLLPGTAQEVARSLGIRYQRPLLEDPEYNVRLGTQYLAQMLRRYDGRAEDALSAYNAGPGRINQWRQRPEYRDRDVFMEHIPFRETRHYVKVVQQNKRIYTALYGCPGFEPCLGDSYRVAVARSPFAGGVPASSLAR